GGGKTANFLQTSSSSVGVPSEWGNVSQDAEITSVVWSKESARKDDEVELKVMTAGVADKTPVVIEIFRRPKTAGTDDPSKDQGGGKGGDGGKGSGKGDGDGGKGGGVTPPDHGDGKDHTDPNAGGDTDPNKKPPGEDDGKDPKAGK